MILSDLVQGSDAWLEVRKTKITSTDASIINGSNTFNKNSPFKLWRQKLGIEETGFVNMRMMEGNRLEQEARDWFNKKYSTNFKPQVLFHDIDQWVMASLDGYEENNEYILEIKCGEATYDKAVKGNVPAYYLDQIYHQLYASGKSRCYYVAYRPDKEPVVISIERDEQLLETLIEKERDFYDYLDKLIPPPLAEAEFVEIRDDKTVQLARRWRETKEKLKIAEKTEKSARQELLEETDDGNCIIPDANVKVERRIRKGNLDYDEIFDEYKINRALLEKYRKPEISWSSPNIIKQA